MNTHEVDRLIDKVARGKCRLSIDGNDLIGSVRLGELPIRQVVALNKVALAPQRRRARKHDALEASSANRFGIDIHVEEVKFDRACNALLEAYRRFSRPERVERFWSSDRWAAVAQVLSKLRGVAAIGHWKLPPPAYHLSHDPDVLAETALDDLALAAGKVDLAEGAIDARILRLASRIATMEDCGEQVGKVESWLSPETLTFAQIALAHFRSAGMTIDRILEEHEARSAVLPVLSSTYGGLASVLACLRERFSKDVHKVLKLKQQPLLYAAHAARSLGLSSSKKVALSEEGRESVADPFLKLCQTTLLTTISSFAEVGQHSKNHDRVERLLDNLLGAAGEGENESAETGISWDVEFTSAQLHRMQRAVKERRPAAAGALALLEDALHCYEKIAEAVADAYGNELTLRTTPVELAQHKALMELVRALRAAWSDTGAVLAPPRQADLEALEKVRLRHQPIVLRAFEVGGHEVATAVLARLALVDEMLQPKEERCLTGEIPWDLLRSYELVEAVLARLEDGGQAALHRRRRWLRCPHGTAQVVLAGEVWRQLERSYLSPEVPFEPLGPCLSMPLTLRELRIATCFFELDIGERLAALLLEVVADFSASKEATLQDLYGLVCDCGAKGAGVGYASPTAHRSTMLASTAESDDSDCFSDVTEDTPRPGFQSNGRRGARSSQDALPMVGAPAEAADAGPARITAKSRVCCERCLRGEMPTFPHVSLGELHRQRGGAAPRGHRPAASSAALPLPRSVNEVKRNRSKEPAEDLESPEAQREFGEDAVIAWATSSLASGIFLRGDERGSYFAWLAQMVLYEAARERADAAKNEGQKAGRKPSVPQTHAGRRRSFTSALGVSVGLLDSDAANAAAARPTDASTSHERSSEKKNWAALEAQLAAQRDEARDARREDVLALPDSVLNALRTDLGLPSTSKKGTDQLAPRGAKAGQDRKDRKLCMTSGLRSLGVSDAQLGYLSRELDGAAAHLIDPHGSLLVGGAVKAAQNILMPGGSQKKQGETDAAVDEQRSSAGKSGIRIHGAALANAARYAKEVVETSRADASRCYQCAGYEPPEERYSSAVALRVLEKQFFDVKDSGMLVRAIGGGRRSAGVADATDGETEHTAALAPLLLSASASKRLLAQLRREEAAAAAAAAEEEAAAAGVNVERRSRGSGLVRVLSLQQATVANDSRESEGESSGGGARKPRTPLRHRHSNLSEVEGGNPRGPRSPAGSPSCKVPSPRLTHTAPDPEDQFDGPDQTWSPAPSIMRATAPAASAVWMPAAPDALGRNTQSSFQDEWHPSVQRLLEAVDDRHQRIWCVTLARLPASPPRSPRSALQILARKEGARPRPATKNTWKRTPLVASHSFAPPAAAKNLALTLVRTGGARARCHASGAGGGGLPDIGIVGGGLGEGGLQRRCASLPSF